MTGQKSIPPHIPVTPVSNVFGELCRDAYHHLKDARGLLLARGCCTQRDALELPWLRQAANGPIGQAGINKKQRDTKGTTNYPGLLANHQHPTVILKKNKNLTQLPGVTLFNHENFQN